MNISAISIKNPVFAWMMMIALIFFGAIGFMNMGVSQLPDVDFPVANVTLNLDGAAPEFMELDVVDIVESSMMGIQGIRSISSTSKAGTANITVEFNLNKNIDIAVQEIQNAITQVARRLPRDLDPAIIRKTNPDDFSIVLFSLTSDRHTLRDLMEIVRDRLRDNFSILPGVAEVVVGGYIDPNLRVWVSPEKLKKYELAVTDVIGAIQTEHAEIPSGRLETKDIEYSIRMMGEASSVEDFGELSVSRRGSQPNFVPLALRQIAEIEDGLAEIRRKSRTGSKTAVAMGVKKQRNANAVEVARLAKTKAAELSKNLPEGMELKVRFDTTNFIEESIHELNFTLVLSALLTAIVCWMFLGSWSATFNIILSIPTSVVGAFIFLHALGFTLNTFTLLGLSLAIGIVVDDAIMVLENIFRHFEKSQNKMQASLEGAREISFAAIAATVAIIAIFLPVAYMSGIIGKFFFQFGVTISIAVALSLLEALTLTPMRCSKFLDVSERTSWFGKLVEKSFQVGAEKYQKLLIGILSHRLKTVFLSLVICVGSYFLIKSIKMEFVPPQDQGRMTLRMNLPVGSSMDRTDSVFKEFEKFLESRPELTGYFASIGGFGVGGDVNTVAVSLTFKPVHERPIDKKLKRPLTQQEYAAIYRQELKKYKGVKSSIQDLSLTGLSAKRGFPIEFAVRGPEWETLSEVTNKLVEEMEKTGAMTDIDTDYKEGLPEIQILPNRVKARQRGVSITDIGQTVNASMGGVVVGKFAKGGHRYDIRVRANDQERKKIEAIEKLHVRNNRGELISLSEVVEIRTEKVLQQIARQDRERAVSVFANIAKNSSQAEAIEKIKALAKTTLPKGYYVKMLGSAQTFEESMWSLLLALGIGIIVSYMVLASQFNSFIHPITVLVALPFSATGALLSLLWFGYTLNVYSMIGLLLLMGIVKKNSILLVDYTNHLRAQGLKVKDALVQACPVRLRPILMTSIATVAGAIPPALALGPGAETRIPMALSIIGGVTFSTALTLFVVPCVYSLLARLNNDDAFAQIQNSKQGQGSAPAVPVESKVVRIAARGR